MFWLQVAPALLFLVTLLLSPESPRYLVAMGRNAEAKAVVVQLLGQGAAQTTLADIAASLTADHKPSLADLRKVGGSWRPIVWVGIGLAVFQQLVGLNVVLYHGAELWLAVGFSEADALKINILSGARSIAACLVSSGQLELSLGSPRTSVWR